MAQWTALVPPEENCAVSRCPEGHIHVELDAGTVSLRFSDEQFLAFARLIGKAAGSVIGSRDAGLQEQRGPGRFWRN
jgi:hypothetical protein